MAQNSKSVDRKALILFSIFLFFQLFTLNYPRLNGDEALGGIMAFEQIQRVLSGELPILQVFVPYVGPADNWLQSLFEWMISIIPAITHQAWSLRFLIFISSAAGLLYLFRELRKHSQEWAAFFLLIVIGCPLIWIHSRLFWCSSYLIGTLSVLIAETLRARRTGQMRWIRLAFFAGLSIEFHPSCYLPLLGVALMNRQFLLPAIKTQFKTLLLATALFIFLVLPELIHFPPPYESAGEASRSLGDELLALIQVLMGKKSIELGYGEENTPTILLLAPLVGMAITFYSRWILSLQKNRQSIQRIPFSDVLIIAGVTLIQLYFSFQGRSLMIPGHDRYFVVFAPLWAYLVSEALAFFTQRNWKTQKRVYLLAGASALIGAAQTLVPLTLSLQNPDPALAALNWLKAECPRGQCVAFAENFWNFWPMRYYDQEKIELNVVGHNWRRMPVYPFAGKKLAVCLFKIQNQEPYRDLYEKRQDFPGQMNLPGITCYTGVNVFKVVPKNGAYNYLE